MIEKGSTVILRTTDAIYSPCQVISMSKDNVTVTYFAGKKKDRQTGEFADCHIVEIIPRKKIVRMSERT